ncbi:MAG: hypothetical protein FWC80_02115 [Firmicutes bacterium]|nr:hypothetical protein [Bacillota bacterium]
MATAKVKAKRSIEYLRKLGIKFYLDLIMGLAVIITVIVALASIGSPDRFHIAVLVGMFIVLVLAIAILIYDLRILLSKINRRSPRFRSAKANAIMMSIIFVVTVVGIILSFVNMFGTPIA